MQLISDEWLLRPQGPRAPLPSRSQRDGSHTASQGAAQGTCFLLNCFSSSSSYQAYSRRRSDREGPVLLTVTPHRERGKTQWTLYSRHGLYFSHHQKTKLCLCSRNPTTHFSTTKHMASVLKALLGQTDVRWRYDDGFGFGVFPTSREFNFHLFPRLLGLFTCVRLYDDVKLS